VGILDRIREHVEQNLAHASFVADEAFRQIAVDVDDKQDGFLGNPRPDDVDAVVEQGV
jgi:hypothetical protein